MTRAPIEQPQLSAYRFPDELRVDELLVRVPVEQDVEALVPAFLDPAVGGEAGLPPLDAAGLRATMRDMLPGLRASGLMSPYVIEDVRAGELLGGLTLHHFDPMRGVVEVGYFLFVEARGRGVATRAVRAAVDDAFAQWLCRVEAHVRVGNERSERVLERVGFEREGIKRRFLRHGDRRVDATLFGIVADHA